MDQEDLLAEALVRRHHFGPGLALAVVSQFCLILSDELGVALLQRVQIPTLAYQRLIVPRALITGSEEVDSSFQMVALGQLDKLRPQVPRADPDAAGELTETSPG